MISKKYLLAANALILKHADKAEEYVAQKKWELSSQNNDEEAETWNIIIKAMREVRKIRKNIKAD